MASRRQCLVAMTGMALQAATRPQVGTTTTTIPRFLLPAIAIGGGKQQLTQQQQTRHATTIRKEKKKAKHKAFRVHDKSKLETFSLCDAMRYLRAVEVGRPPTSVTYDIAVKLQTNKDGAVLRDRIRLPFPCSSDLRIAVVCPEGSKIAMDARQDGAVAVGEDTLFAAIKAG